MTAGASLANPKTGTARAPQNEKFNLNFGQVHPDGQPPTSVTLLIDFPPQLTLSGLLRWAAGQRCDSAKADQQKSDRVCPKGSKVGAVNVTAKAAGGSITQILKGPIYVIKPRGGGAAASAAGLGFWITSTSPVAVAQFLPGKVNRRTGVLSVSIPKNLQQPVAGVKSGIQQLKASIFGKNAKGGGLLVSKGCPRSKRLTLKVTSVNDDGGRVSDSATFRCA